MHAFWEALMSYPPSLGALLLAMAAPLVVLVGVVGTIARKDASRGFALATTIGPAVAVLLALTIMALGATSGIGDSVEGWMMADPSQRSARLADGIATSLWSTALGSALLVFLVPSVTFGCATVWGLRNRREGEPVRPLLLTAAGVSGPSFFLGSLIAAKATGFIQMFGVVAFVAPEERVAVVEAGLAEIQSPLSSGVGVALFFVLGFGVAAAGAFLAARSDAHAPSWAIVVAAFFAFAGVVTVASLWMRVGDVEDLRAIAAELEPLPAYEPMEDELDY